MGNFSETGQIKFSGDITISFTDSNATEQSLLDVVNKALSHTEDLEVECELFEPAINEEEGEFVANVSFSQTVTWSHTDATWYDPPEDDFSPDPIDNSDVESEISKLLSDEYQVEAELDDSAFESDGYEYESDCIYDL